MLYKLLVALGSLAVAANAAEVPLVCTLLEPIHRLYTLLTSIGWVTVVK
jgi:hypothetical protein